MVGSAEGFAAPTAPAAGIATAINPVNTHPRTANRQRRSLAFFIPLPSPHLTMRICDKVPNPAVAQHPWTPAADVKQRFLYLRASTEPGIERVLPFASR